MPHARSDSGSELRHQPWPLNHLLNATCGTVTRARGTGSVYRVRYTDRRTGERREAATFAIQWYDRRAHRYVREYGFASDKAAERALRHRLADQERGQPTGPSIERTTFEDLAALIVTDYELNGRRLPRLRQSLAHLRRAFGPDRAVEIDTARVARYTALRVQAGAKPATVNRELAALKRMFRLGVQAKRVGQAPHIATMKENNTRTGFFEDHQVEAILRHLPADLRPVVRVAYFTGWRVPSEILTRQWRHVDFEAGTLRLEPGEGKNKEGRTFPLDPDLRPILEALRAETTALEQKWGRIIPWVFHRGGRQIKSFTRSWATARRKAGLPGMLKHDFRRTAARNLVRAGVLETVAMKLTGHKTRSVFERYAIVTEDMLKNGAEKLAKARKGRTG